MSFTPSTTTTNVHQSLGDFPAEDNHLTAEQLKELFDAPATGLKGDINTLIGELEATSSAASIGASQIADSDTSSANVQAKLNKIYQDLQDAALGEIPDNSITQAKLVTDFSNSLAIKDGNRQVNLNADKVDGYDASSFALKNGNIQTGLNSEKLGGSTKAQIVSSIVDRVSPAEFSETVTLTNSNLVTKTYNNIKTRYLLFVASASTSFPSSSTTSAKEAIALFDCKNNNFIFTSRISSSTPVFDFFATTLKTQTNNMRSIHNFCIL